ncbi:MAG: TetR/AcrR family transcriptional regulator [bacterium]
MGRKKLETGVEQIVLVAVYKEIARKGYANLSIGDIIKRSNMSRTTINKYFKSKENILWTILFEIWHRVLENVKDEIVSSDFMFLDSKGKLKKVLIFSAKLFVHHISASLIVFWEDRNKCLFNMDAIEPLDDFLSLLDKLLKKGQEEKIIRGGLDVYSIFAVWREFIIRDSAARTGCGVKKYKIKFDEESFKKILDLLLKQPE